LPNGIFPTAIDRELAMRRLLYLGAVLMLAWVVTATLLWIGPQGDPLAAFWHFWAALRSDWMLVLIVTDMAVFTAAALVWVALDLRRRDATAAAVVAWLVPMLLLGSAILLVYVARRTREPAAATGAGAA
jgi:hypothetical protein